MSSEVAAARGRNALLPLFIVSGGAALIYEVVWFQSLSLIIGSSAVSMAVVLATYMGGMGLGSLVYLRWRGRFGHPLRIYAQLELLIAICALLVLYVLPWAGGLYTAVGGGGFSGILLRGLFCAIFLLPPTMAMGATLPAAAGWLQSTPEGVSRAGFYYTANIAGGVIGCLVAGFHLLRVYDIHTATYVGVVLNLIVAGAAWMLSRVTPDVPAEPAAERSATPVVSPWRGPDLTVYIAIGLSGACALGSQVIWTRNLALLLGGTVYTFSLILGTVLLGLGMGSSFGASVVRNSRDPRRALVVCQVLAVAGLAWAGWMISSNLPYWPINPGNAPAPTYLFQLDFLRSFLVALPASLCWGASFPLAVAAVADGRGNSSAAVARVYAANTAGAIVGALCTGLVLVAWIGTQQSQRLLMVLSLAAALVLLLPALRGHSTARARTWAAATGVAAVVVLAVGATFVHKLPGPLVGYGRWTVTWLPPQVEFLYVGEGLNSTLAVSRGPDGTLNYHNAGKVQASSQPNDMRLQRMLGHLTTLLAKDPRNVLVIGSGAGVTAGAVSVNPAVQTQTIAEIEPLVPRVVSEFFARENHGVIDNPKVKIRIDDARHFLLTTDEKFDAITADPFDAWVKGAASLNTAEFYAEMKRHLNPGAVVTAWLPFYETTVEAIKSEVATFAAAFPHVIIFGNTAGGQGYDGVMVGSMEPFEIDVNAMEARLNSPEFEPVLRSLDEVGYGSVQLLLGTFAATGDQLQNWLGNAEINRDRNLRLQYLAGLGVNNYEQAGIYAEILREGAWPAEVFRGDLSTLSRLRSEVMSQR
ncbi:MAG: fused MFS/spermidine synthase [Pseudomonadota bacterium]|nr:fused MFS/spermidine synthase [Pseudomonadota bacterium]